MSQRFAGYMNKVGANIKLDIIQNTTLLGTARLLKKVLSLYGHKSRNTVGTLVTCCRSLSWTRHIGHMKSETTYLNFFLLKLLMYIFKLKFTNTDLSEYR